ETAARRLNLDVIMPRAAGVDRRHDGAKTERAVVSSGDVSTISKTYVVVLAFFIGMPEIDHGSGKRAAASRQHKASKFDRTASSARLAQVTAFRRFGLEEWPLGLPNSWFIAVKTGRRGCEFLRQDDARAGQFPPGGKHAGAEHESAASLFRELIHDHDRRT